MVYNFYDSVFTISLVSIGTQILGRPLVKIIVGNPAVLEVNAEGSFDDADNYLMKVSVASKSMIQVRFSLIAKKHLPTIEKLQYKLRKSLQG